MINAAAADVIFFTSIINSGKRMETLRYNENCSGKWLAEANEVLQHALLFTLTFDISERP